MHLEKCEVNSLSGNQAVLSMICGDAGELLCTNRDLCVAVNISQRQLHMVRARHKSRLHPICTTDCGPNLQQFIRDNRVELKIAYLRDDMLLWPIREALKVALYVHTEEAYAFHEAALDAMLYTMRRTLISRVEHEALVEKVERLQLAVEQARPSLQIAASAAGFALNAQKGTKDLRTLH